MGRDTLRHFEELLDTTRNLDRVLALVQPEKLSMKSALFDRIEAHPVLATAKLEELPLPHEFVVASRIESLVPAQQLAVDAGLLFGKDLLVVAATASGKTFIGEMAGMKNYLAGRGRMLFLVPLVALANQKYERFTERYSAFAKTGLLTGVSRLNLPETRKVGDRNPQAPIVVGTYEGVDNMIRCGQRMQNIATVVIDEVQMLEDPDRGHRLDGLVARLSTSPRRHSSCTSPPPSDHQRRSQKNSTASSSGTTTGRSRSNAISFSRSASRRSRRSRS